MAADARRKAGRPASGPNGEHVADMPKVRLPAGSLDQVRELAAEHGVAVWRVVELAVQRFAASPGTLRWEGSGAAPRAYHREHGAA
jgi:hypothetical protein